MCIQDDIQKKSPTNVGYVPRGFSAGMSWKFIQEFTLGKNHTDVKSVPGSFLTWVVCEITQVFTQRKNHFSAWYLVQGLKPNETANIIKKMFIKMFNSYDEINNESSELYDLKVIVIWLVGYVLNSNSLCSSYLKKKQMEIQLVLTGTVLICRRTLSKSRSIC